MTKSPLYFPIQFFLVLVFSKPFNASRLCEVSVSSIILLSVACSVSMVGSEYIHLWFAYQRPVNYEPGAGIPVCTKPVYRDFLLYFVCQF